MKLVKIIICFVSMIAMSNVFADKTPTPTPTPDQESVPESVFMSGDKDVIGDVPGSSCPPQVSIGTPSEVDTPSSTPSGGTTPDGGTKSY